jgi:hypothetical protein
MKDWSDKLMVPLVGLFLNAAVTYGVVSTQLQWVRADLERQQRQIERLENRLFNGGRE